MITCDYCDCSFSDDNTFIHHIENSKDCPSYKNLLISCRKCGLILTFKDIKKHTSDCNPKNKIENELRLLKAELRCLKLSSNMVPKFREIEVEASRNTNIEKPKKQVYRSIKKEIIGSNEEKDEENFEQKIKEVDENIHTIAQKNFGDEGGILSQFPPLFEKLNKENYSNSLKDMRILRIKLLGLLSLEKYSKIVEEHLQKL